MRGGRDLAGRVALAVAAAAAVAAYLLAYLPPRGALWISPLGASLLLPSVRLQSSRMHPRLVRLLPRALQLAALVTGLVTVFSRDVLFQFLSGDTANLLELLSGCLLSLLAAIFLYGSRFFSLPRTLLPAVVAVLVAAGANPHARGFLPLAALAGLALWTHAVLTGGPERLSVSLVLFGLSGASLAAAGVWFLPWAEPRATLYLARTAFAATTGLSDESQLGDVEALALSRRIVARVWTRKPQLLRMQVFASFDGHSWLEGPVTQHPLYPLDTEEAARAPLDAAFRSVPGRIFTSGPFPPGGPLLSTRILPAMTFDDGWGALLPAGSRFLAWPADGLKVDDLGVVRAEAALPALYAAASQERRTDEGRPSEEDLTLPPRLDPRVRDLARALGPPGRPAREIVERTLGHLQSHYRYTLEIGRFRSKDPLAEFLFSKKEGYCEYFASAAVVLLRLQGLPARYVKGVQVRSESRVAGHYVVRESDAHAWVDAYLPGEGWVEEDPTPPGGFRLTHKAGGEGSWADLWEALVAGLSEALAEFSQGTWPGITSALSRAFRASLETLKAHPLATALLFVGALVLPLLRSLRRLRGPRLASRPRSQGAPLPEDLKAALAAVEGHWSRHGRPRPQYRGLQEHLLLTPREALYSLERETISRVVDTYYRVSFGGEAVDAETLAEIRRSAGLLP